MSVIITNIPIDKLTELINFQTNCLPQIHSESKRIEINEIINGLKFLKSNQTLNGNIYKSCYKYLTEYELKNNKHYILYETIGDKLIKNKCEV